MKSRFEQVRRYYLAGYWDARMLADAVTKGWISEEEYDRIVSEKRGDVV